MPVVSLLASVMREIMMDLDGCPMSITFTVPFLGMMKGDCPVWAAVGADAILSLGEMYVVMRRHFSSDKVIVSVTSGPDDK